MRVPLPERLQRPPRQRNDIIRLAAGNVIVLSELGYRVTGGSYESPYNYVIYGGAAVALGLIAMPLARLNDNYFGNLRYRELYLTDTQDNTQPADGHEGFYSNGNSPHLEPFNADDLD